MEFFFENFFSKFSRAKIDISCLKNYQNRSKIIDYPYPDGFFIDFEWKMKKKWKFSQSTHLGSTPAVVDIFFLKKNFFPRIFQLSKCFLVEIWLFWLKKLKKNFFLNFLKEKFCKIFFLKTINIKILKLIKITLKPSKFPYLDGIFYRFSVKMKILPIYTPGFDPHCGRNIFSGKKKIFFENFLAFQRISDSNMNILNINFE